MTDTTLLCERCGYVLAGLPESGHCPECSKAIAESLPQRRTGSPWQIRPFRLGPWVRTSWRALARPRRLFAAVVIVAAASRSLLRVNLWIAALALVGALANLLGYPRIGTPQGLGGLMLVVLTAPCMCGVLWILTGIEVAGIQFFGKQRKWRINSDVATVICGHASVGWVLGCLGVLIISFLWMTQWSPRAGIGRRIEGLVHYTVWVPSMAGAFFAGLLIFEILVYIGVRECRFANPPGAGSRPAHEPPSTTPPAR